MYICNSKPNSRMIYTFELLYEGCQAQQQHGQTPIMPNLNIEPASSRWQGDHYHATLASYAYVSYIMQLAICVHAVDPCQGNALVR